jgi:hypothetical protein
MSYNLIKSDRVISSFMRTVGTGDINVDDIYEWIGEANNFLSTPTVLKQTLIFLEVKNYQAPLPKYFKSLLQVARDESPTELFCKTAEVIPTVSTTTTVADCNVDEGVLLACDGSPLCEVPVAFYRPSPYYNPFPITYNQWTNSVSYNSGKRFVPIRASTNTLFKSNVCKEQNWKELYSTSSYEYTILHNREFRFTFEEGVVAVSYLEDFNSGEVPMVIDNQSHLSAIQYYLLWKHAEVQMLRGVQGSVSLNDRFEARWLKYCKQAKNDAMMPDLATMDNIYQNTYKMLPSLKVFGDMFSDLSKEASASYILNENLTN